MKSLVFILLLIATSLSAQEKEQRSSLQLYFGRSLHGTGDARGIEYGGIYRSDFSRKLFWFAEIGGSIHADEWPLSYTTPSGEWIDASIHYTTAGVQAVGGAGAAIIKNQRHDLSLRLGAVVRYQSSSYWDEAAVYYPSGNGFDFPVVTFVNTTPKKTMSLGGRGSFSYSFTFTPKFFVAVNASLQTDSNGDTLTSATLGIGRKL